MTDDDTQNKTEAGANASAFFAAVDRDDTPEYELVLRPNRSLPIKGFVWLIGVTAGLMTLPLWPLLGTMALWGLLPWLLGVLTLLWYFVQRNYRDAALYEHLRLWPDLIAVHRHNPRAADAFWLANPYWVKLTLYKNAKIENYLTLTGKTREIELGAFLSSDERQKLYEDLQAAINRCKAAP